MASKPPIVNWTRWLHLLHQVTGSMCRSWSVEDHIKMLAWGETLLAVGKEMKAEAKRLKGKK